MLNTTWNTGRNWMLGLALTAGLLGTGATANAVQPFRGRLDPSRSDLRHDDRREERRNDRRDERRDQWRDDRRFDGRVEGRDYRGGLYAGGGGYAGGGFVSNYIPPCPGEGYVWTAGYYNGGVWYPGAWTFRSNRGYGYGYRGNDRAFDRGYDRALNRDRREDQRIARDDRRGDHGPDRGFDRGREERGHDFRGRR